MNTNEHEDTSRFEMDMNADSRKLPPRRIIHPSEKGIWTRRFYHSLIFIFIALTVGLIVWGVQYNK